MRAGACHLFPQEVVSSSEGWCYGDMASMESSTAGGVPARLRGEQILTCLFHLHVTSAVSMRVISPDSRPQPVNDAGIEWWQSCRLCAEGGPLLLQLPSTRQKGGYIVPNC